MSRKQSLLLILCVTILSLVRPAGGEVTDDQVNTAIQKGIAYLKKNQKVDGSWTPYPGIPGGMTGLCTLALLNAGVDPASPQVQKALNYLRSVGEPVMVYGTSLQTMVFCVAGFEKDRVLISRNVQWLEQVQIKSGKRRGAWKYSNQSGQGGGDNSNTQFAMLALHEAERVGVKVSETTWQAALEYWLGSQYDNGAWGYLGDEPETGSMTCAGTASVVIALGKISQGDARVIGNRVECCGPQLQHDGVQRALHWLGRKFSATRNPSPIKSRAWLYYYLYGVERVGRLTGRRFIGRHDWFREGSEFLIGQQDGFSGYWRGESREANPLVATSFALLFLSKGRRPVLISKLRHGAGNDWDHHRAGVQKLTRRVERRWKRDLSWQSIDARAATVEDLLQTPVLFLSGENSLNLTPEDEENLRQYVNQGGFIFAEACCAGGGFDASFRALMKKLFPDNSLRLLPPEHPIWYAEEKVDSKYLRPLYGIDACCRTSVVYCPQDLSCYWELSQGERATNYPPEVAAEIEACLRIGQNVVTYATNRELKNKLDRPQVYLHRSTDEPARGVLYVAKLMHQGGGDDAPNALPNLLGFVRSQAQIRVGVENRLISPSDSTIFEYPILYMHGRRAFRFSQAERKNLATYLQRGGLIFADAICASPEFSRSFRREIETLFAGQTLQRVPPQHPLFSRRYRGFELPSVSLRDPQVRREGDPLRTNLTRISPLLEGLELAGRLVVVFSPYDISCALENSTSLECKGYVREDAARMGANVILFALQQ